MHAFQRLATSTPPATKALRGRVLSDVSRDDGAARQAKGA
jgi:hypothetical protein